MYVFLILQIWLESFSYVMLTLMHICIRHDTIHFSLFKWPYCSGPHDVSHTGILVYFKIKIVPYHLS